MHPSHLFGPPAPPRDMAGKAPVDFGGFSDVASSSSDADHTAMGCSFYPSLLMAPADLAPDGDGDDADAAAGAGAPATVVSPHSPSRLSAASNDSSVHSYSSAVSKADSSEDEAAAAPPHVAPHSRAAASDFDDSGSIQFGSGY